MKRSITDLAAGERKREKAKSEETLTKAQELLQRDACEDLAYWFARCERHDEAVRRGLMHPLQHPLAPILAEIHTQQLLSAKHPATVRHPLA